MFKVYKESCKNCLMSSNSIVSPERRKDIIKDCLIKQTHFICHKASIQGNDICCQSFFDRLGHRVKKIVMAKRLDCVQFIDQPYSEKLPTYREMNNK